MLAAFRFDIFFYAFCNYNFTILQLYSTQTSSDFLFLLVDRYVVGFGILDPLSTSDSLQSTIRTKKLAPNVKKRKFISPTRSRRSAAQPSECWTPKRRTTAATSSKQRWRCWGCAQWIFGMKNYWTFFAVIIYVNLSKLNFYIESETMHKLYFFWLNFFCLGLKFLRKLYRVRYIREKKTAPVYKPCVAWSIVFSFEAIP